MSEAIAIPKQVIERYVTYALQCQHCRIKFCRDGCPVAVATGRETLAAYGKWGGILMVHRGLQEFTPEFAKGFLYCTTCEWCAYRCPNWLFAGDFYLKKQPTVDMVLDIRAELTKAGFKLSDELHAAMGYVRTVLNPYGAPRAERRRWIPSDVKIAGKAESLLFLGCTSAFMTQSIAVAIARTLNALDIEFAYAAQDEPCCGSIMLRAGYIDAATECAKRVDKLIKDTGAKRIITSCPGCYRMLKLDYPERLGVELDVDIIHISELLADLIDAGKLKFAKELKINATYHDPCHLGRPFEIFDQPRRILESIPGLTLVEMARTRNLSICCGAGGGIRTALHDLALKIATERIAEAERAGAAMLITNCPFCYTNLSEAARKYEGRLEVLDLIEIVNRAMQA